MRQTSFVSSMDSRLGATVWDGDGPRHVLLHGLSSNARTWRAVAGMLAADGAAIVAYDQRCHGTSERTAGGFDIAGFADDAILVLDQLGWPDATVVGQSWGGNVAVEVAARHRDRCRSVIGVDGGFIHLASRFDSWEACAAALAPPRFQGLSAGDVRTRLRDMHPEWSQAGIEDTLGNFRETNDGFVEPALAFDDHMEILRSLFEHDPAARLRRSDTPSLAIAARPSMIDAADIESIGFDAVAWIDGDHDLHVHRPSAVADAIRRFAWE